MRNDMTLMVDKNNSIEEDYSCSWRVLQGIVASVSEGTVKAYGFNRSAIGIGMEVVIELSRKSGNNPYVHGVVLNLENQGRVDIIIWGDHRGISCGDYVYCTGRLISSEVGFNLLGKVISLIGVSLLDVDTSDVPIRRPIEIDAIYIFVYFSLCANVSSHNKSIIGLGTPYIFA